MKKLNVILLLVAIAMAFCNVSFALDIDPNSIPESVQTDRNTGFIAMGTQTYITNKASAAVDIGSLLPNNCTSGKVYVYNGEAVFGYSDLAVGTTVAAEGEIVASGSFYEIKGRKPYTPYVLYVDCAGAATGPITLVIVPKGE